jgi:hypothetical protein
VRVFATKWFVRFARKERLSQEQICEAVARAERGSIDADLSGGLIKQRVARSGRGKSGGYRTLIAYQESRRSVFVYGFAKNERANIDPTELADLRILSKRLLDFTAHEMEVALSSGELKEITSVQDEEDAG